MIRHVDFEPAERDERLGEAIEEYLTLAEGGQVPEVGAFAARHPGLEAELKDALEGLALVRGLVGDAHEAGGHRLEAGRQVAGYRIVGELGRGGMGVVYEAVHVALDRPVALKVLGAHAAPDSTGRRRFLNEARTAAALHHTHIVPVFDVGQVGGLCYYAMQRIEGSGLDRVLRVLRAGRSTAAGSGSLRPPSALPKPEPPEDLTSTWLGGPEAQGLSARGVNGVKAVEEIGPPPYVPPRGSAYYRWVAGVGRSAADALAYAHGRGVVHRDIKPSNLLVDARGEAWVADFGLARRLSDPALTRSDGLLGTPRYMSPEQAEARAVDARTDVYSLGATLYELLTLRPPFEGQAAAELIRQILDREPPAPRRSDPRIPRDLETIVLKALGKRPGDRYPTAAELADDLGRFLAMEPVRARRIGPLGRTWRLARRNPVASGIAVAAAATVVTTAAVAHINVLHSLKDAKDANIATRTALEEAESAKVRLTGALRELRISEASYLRLSALPERRRLGLDLLEKAARLGADPATRAKLRDEAVEFLALRDVEPRVAPPAGPTQAVAYGPGGDRLALLSADLGTLSLWESATGTRLGTVPLAYPSASAEGSRRGGRGQGPGGPEFRRGSRLASAGPRLAVLPPAGPGVTLLDAQTGRPAGTLEAAGCEFVALLGSAVGGRLLTVDRPAPQDRSQGRRGPGRRGDGPGFRVRLWDPAHPEAAPATVFEQDGPRLPLLALDPAGELVVAVRDPATAPTAAAPADEPKVVPVASLSLWSARDGRPLGTIEVTADVPTPVTAVALGPDGLLAAAVGGVIRLWDARSQAQLPPLNPQQGGVTLLRFSPDGTTLALASRDRGIELWDTATATHVVTLPTAGRVADLAFSPRPPAATTPRGLTLSAAVDGAAAPSSWAIVEPAGVVRLPESDLSSPFGTVAFGADGVLAVAASPGPNMMAPAGPLHLWWPGTCPTTTPAWEHARPRALAFGDRGQLLALDAEGLASFPPPSLAALKGHPEGPEPTGRVALPAPTDPFGSDRPAPPGRPAPMTIARAASGRDLALTRGDEVWLVGTDLADPPRRVTPPPEADSPGALGGRGGRFPFPLTWTHAALAPDASRIYLLSSWREEKLHAWALDGGDQARDLGWGGRRRVTALALSPDGRTLALGEDSGAITLLDTASGEPRAQIAPPAGGSDRVWALAFSPVGAELAVGSREHTRLWRLGESQPEPLVTLPGHRGPAAVLAYDPPGRSLAVGGIGRPVAVWDLDLLRRELGRRGLGW